MKAAVCIVHGDPTGVEIKEIDNPKINNNEILIKIKASTVTSGDVALRSQSTLKYILLWPLARFLFGIKNQRKKVLGHEFSGIVEKVGGHVSRFKAGDKVFGTTGFKGGAHAEYISLSENGVISTKPDGISFEEAAALPIGSICALQFLKKANIQYNDRVLIYGASGSIGTYAIQFAKHFGAITTGVCSTHNINLVESLGADNVFDYTKYDISKSKEKFDIVFDTVGKLSKSKSRQIMTKNGRYISTHSSPVKEKIVYLDFIKHLAVNGVIKPVIDRTYNIDEIQLAHTYVETGRKKGNVIITFNHGNN